MRLWPATWWPFATRRSGTVPEDPEPVPEQAELCLPKWVKEFDGQPVKLWDDDTEARSGTDLEHVAAILSSFRNQKQTGWVQLWIILRLYPEICWANGLEPLTNRLLSLALTDQLKKAKRRIDGGRPVTCYFVPAEPENVASASEAQQHVSRERATGGAGNVLRLATVRRETSSRRSNNLKSQTVTSRRHSVSKAAKGGGRAFDGLPVGAFVNGPASAGAGTLASF